MSENQIKTYADLPEDVVDFLSDPDSYDQIVNFAEKYKVDSENISELIGLVDDIVLGRIALAQLPIELVENIGINPGLARKATIEFATTRLLPVAGVIGDVATQIVQWGGKSEQGSALKAVSPQLTPEIFVKSILEQSGLALADPVLEHRLELVAASLLTKERTMDEAVDKLMRPTKVGGLKMEEAAAKELLELVKSKSTGMVFKSKNRPMEPVEPLNVVPQAEEAPKTQGASDDHFNEEDQREVDEITAKVAALPPLGNKDPLADALNEIMSLIKYKVQKEDQSRLQTLVESRLREVRTARNVQKYLELPREQGGFALKGKIVADTLQIIEEVVVKLEVALKNKQERERQQAADKRKAEREDLKKQEVAGLSKRYADMTGNLPSEHVEPPIQSRGSMAISKKDALARQAAQIDDKKVAQMVQAAKPRPVAAALSEQSLSPTKAKRKMLDVQGRPHLAGPVEEIGTMSLTQFRRLSSDPKAAKTKILDKVGLLDDLGPEKRIQAISAWRESPLYKLYLDLTNKALMNGQSIESYVESNPGEGIPTSAEVMAIRELNSSLRF